MKIFSLLLCVSFLCGVLAQAALDVRITEGKYTPRRNFIEIMLPLQSPVIPLTETISVYHPRIDRRAVRIQFNTKNHTFTAEGSEKVTGKYKIIPSEFKGNPASLELSMDKDSPYGDLLFDYFPRRGIWFLSREAKQTVNYDGEALKVSIKVATLTEKCGGSLEN